MTRRVLFLVAALLAGARLPVLAAQGNIRNSITLSAITIPFPTATEADYDAGAVAASSPITVTFDSKKNAGNQPNVQRTSTISIRATSTTLGGTKPIGDLQWQRNGTAPGGWNSLTTTDAVVESRQFVFNGVNDPWSTTVYFQTLLSWANDPPGSYAATVVFTLTITTP